MNSCRYHSCAHLIHLFKSVSNKFESDQGIWRNILQVTYELWQGISNCLAIWFYSSMNPNVGLMLLFKFFSNKFEFVSAASSYMSVSTADGGALSRADASGRLRDGPSGRLRDGPGERERATANRFRTDRQTQSQPHARGCSSGEIKQVK